MVEAGDLPEPALTALKAYAGRALNEAGLDDPARRRWARHGSTRYLWREADVIQALGYVLEGQGEPLEVYVKPD